LEIGNNQVSGALRQSIFNSDADSTPFK